jgi:hypothetical protein
MKRGIFISLILFLGLAFCLSCVKAKEEAGSAQIKQEVKVAVQEALKEQAAGTQASVAQQPAATQQTPVTAKPKIILLISEQNIEGPQRAWWASEIDLSTVEARLAQQLIAQGYEVLEPSNLTQVIKQDSAFRLLDISEAKSIKLGNLSRADYVVLGKAVASAGGNVPQSTMRSCYANVSARLIRVNDGKVIAYLNAAGNSAHPDVVTGGNEALGNAGEDLAAKIIDALNSQGGN